MKDPPINSLHQKSPRNSDILVYCSLCINCNSSEIYCLNNVKLLHGTDRKESEIIHFQCLRSFVPLYSFSLTVGGVKISLQSELLVLITGILFLF